MDAADCADLMMISELSSSRGRIAEACEQRILSSVFHLSDLLVESRNPNRIICVSRVQFDPHHHFSFSTDHGNKLFATIDARSNPYATLPPWFNAIPGGRRLILTKTTIMEIFDSD
jgi:hypothetical protein